MAHPKQIEPDDIVAAALRQLEANGWAAVSLRTVAGELGVKAPSLYRYYKHKGALEEAIVMAGSALMQQVLERAIRGSTGLARVERLAGAYLRFARSRKALYRFMTEGAFEQDTSPTGKGLWRLVVAVVSEHTRKPDDTAAAVALWAFLHGYVSLELSGRFGTSGPRGGFERGLRALLRDET